MKTFEMEIPANRLSNMAWSRLHELMGDELGSRHPELEPVQEAETLLQFKRALAERADFVLIRLRYDDGTLASENQTERGNG